MEEAFLHQWTRMKTGDSLRDDAAAVAKVRVFRPIWALSAEWAAEGWTDALGGFRALRTRRMLFGKHLK